MIKNNYIHSLVVFNTLLLVSIGFTGCNKFLDKHPISNLTEDSYYRNTNEVETGVLGAYASLRDVYNDDPVLAGLRSDDAYISETDGDINQVDNFSETSNNSYVANYWQDAYYAIKQCNTVLKYLGNVSDSNKRNYFEGEAKFIRAHMYFNLVRLWGDVPLITKSVQYNDQNYYKRISIDSVYTQIVNDFTVATQKLPNNWKSDQIARVTNYAAKGMLAKVYLTLKNYSAARPLLLDLIQNPGQFKLLTDYTSVFGVDDEMNSEIMYAVRYSANSNGIGNTFTFNMDKFPGSPGYRAATDFRGTASFPTGDSIRKSQTFLNGGNYAASYYCAGKYQDPGSLKYDGGADFIVLRYADIIMMYAEVVNEMDGATPLTVADLTNPISRLYQLNRIRSRATGNFSTAVPTYNYTSTAVNSQTSFRTTIKAERRREFGEEDQRWYDLLRWGDAITVMNNHFKSRSVTITVRPTQTLYPIPQREIDVSNHILTQNP